MQSKISVQKCLSQCYLSSTIIKNQLKNPTLGRRPIFCSENKAGAKQSI